MTADEVNSFSDNALDGDKLPEHGGMFKKVFVKEFLMKVLLPGLVVILFVNTFFKDTEPKNAGEVIDKALGAGNYESAGEEFRKLIADHFFDLQLHRGYIKNQLDIRPSSGQGKDAAESVYYEYDKYSRDDDARVADIGHYGLGYYCASKKEYEAALKHYLDVKNKELDFLNNSLGFVYNKLGQVGKAKECFYKEIETNGINKAGASYNLAKMLYDERDFDGLNMLISDPNTRDYVPIRVVRMVDLKRGRILSYLVGSFHYNYVSGTGLIAALLILAAWFNYLRRIDVFEPERLRYLLIVLFGGMVFSELCTVLYDLMDYGVGLKINGEIFNDLLYCVFGIGLIEETVKIIPFLIMLKFSRQINESIDYVIYAAIPALGFAFMENVMYFQGSGLQNITGRTLTAVLLHMSLSTLAMYGLFYSRYRKNNEHKMLYFAGSFFAAMVVHGLYDFVLICEKVPSEFRIFSLLILIVCMSKFSLIVRNALNISKFNIGQTGKIENLSKYLVYSLSGVILLQYFLMAWKFGAENTNASMLGSIGTFYFMMFIIVAILGNIKITRSKWTGLFDQNSSANKLDARAARAADSIGVDWGHLKGKYGKWESLAGISLLGVSLLIAALYTGLFILLSHILHPFDENTKFVILPAWPIWAVPSLFLGIVTAVLPLTVILKKLLGIERFKEYEIYDRLKNGPYGKKVFLILSAIMVSICAVTLPLCLDHYVEVHDNGITLSKFAGFGAVYYSYDDVKELRQIESQKNESGKITHELYFEIVFNDEYVLTFHKSVFDLSYDEQRDVMKFIADNCDVELQAVNPYPKKNR